MCFWNQHQKLDYQLSIWERQPAVSSSPLRVCSGQVVWELLQHEQCPMDEAWHKPMFAEWKKHRMHPLRLWGLRSRNPVLSPHVASEPASLLFGQCFPTFDFTSVLWCLCQGQVKATHFLLHPHFFSNPHQPLLWTMVKGKQKWASF